MWLIAYLAIGVVLAGIAEADDPGDWCLCLLLWPIVLSIVLLYTLGQTIGSYFK